MYKTSISLRMLFMTGVIGFGLIVFSVILVSRSLDIYTQNHILRERLSQKEALVKKFSEHSEALNQYRLLEKELRKLVDHSSMAVVYAKNNASAPSSAKAASPTSPAPQAQTVDVGSNSDESSQWEQEPDVPVDLAEDSQEIIETNEQVPDVTVAASGDAPNQPAASSPPHPDKLPAESTPEKPPVTVDENKDKPASTQPAENKPAPKPETNVAQAPTGPLVDVNDLSLSVVGNNTVNFQYKLSNIHPDNKTVAGYIFIILANPYINPPLFAPFPAAPLVGGFPADYRMGTQFSIKHGKTVRGKLPGLIDPGHYNQAWIFAYSKDGELILKKHLISNNG